MKRKFVMLYSMLGISLLLFAVGAFAWFTVSSSSTVSGSQIQAVTEGQLRVLAVSPANVLPPTPTINNYDFSVNFGAGGNFADPAINAAKRTNISGNGATFYKLVGGDPEPSYSDSVSGVHSYVEFVLYFSAFDGDTTNSGVEYDRYVYLMTASAVTDVSTGAEDISKAIRIAFLDSTNALIGVWAPNPSSYTPLSGANAGDIYYVKSGNVYPDATGILGDVLNASSIPTYDTRRIYKGGVTESVISATPLLKVNTKVEHSANQFMTVRIWIEGTDTVSSNSNIRALSNISMVFTINNSTETFAPQPKLPE